MTTTKRKNTTLERFRDDPRTFIYSLAFRTPEGLRPFGEVAADYQRAWIDAITPAYIALARGDSPAAVGANRIFLEATKGAGKGHILAAFNLWLLTFSSRRIDGQLAAADGDQASEIPKSMAEWMQNNDWLHESVDIQAKAVIGKKTGVRLEIIPADIAGSHGSRPLLLSVDELHAIQRWPFVQNLLDNSAKVDGVVILATNSGFEGTECHKMREICRASSRWRFLQYAKPAPHITREELEEAARRNSRERQNRLFHGIWSKGNGDALDLDDVLACVDTTLHPMANRFLFLPNGRQASPIILGAIDLGIRHDHSALVTLACVFETHRVQLADVKWWAPSKITGRVDLQAVENEVIAAHKRFTYAAVYYDPYQAELMAQRLRSRGINMIEYPFVGSNLNTMASTLVETFRSRAIDLYDCQRLVDDLNRLTIIEKSYGMKLESVRDASGHSDVATALAICLPHAVAAFNGVSPVCNVDYPFWVPQGLEGALPAAHINDRHAHLHEPPPPRSRLGGFLPHS